MTTEVRVPALPESITDATILVWHRLPGDPISRDENLLDLETDKVILEVPAPVDGVLARQLFEAGDRVTADQLLALIEPVAENTPASSGKAVPGDPVLTPSVRRLVKEFDLDPGLIQGTGKEGRILKTDVVKSLEGGGDKLPENTVSRPERRVSMSRLRTRIAERLIEAQQTAAILTTFNEVNLQRVMELRDKYRETFEQEHGVRLGLMSFFVKASIEALRRFPLINAAIDGNDILYHDYYDIAVAIGSPRGLVVPILRDADRLSFAGIEKGIKALAKKAEEGTLSYEELTGGTFSITNGGVYGSLLSTPILNPPQSAILGMHGIQERPVAENGEIVIRPMMYLALSYDHRLIDGRDAVSFLVAVKEYLEDPARLLLEL